MNIRCSMLPNVLDCERRAIANQFRKFIEDAGFKLNVKRTGIYNIVGNGTHAANWYMLKNKILTGKLSPVNDAIEYGVEKFYSDLKESEDVLYDDVTPTKDHGQMQIYRMTKAYYRDIAPRLQFPENARPEDHLEKYVCGKIQDFDITGHIDVTTVSAICDTKSGKMARAFHSQLGGYANLEMSAGNPKPKYLMAHYLPRIHNDKPYPNVKIQLYPVDFSINEAWYIINQIIRDVNYFKENQNPACFPANPQSSLCNKKYCVAYNTNFCQYCKE